MLSGLLKEEQSEQSERSRQLAGVWDWVSDVWMSKLQMDVLEWIKSLFNQMLDSFVLAPLSNSQGSQCRDPHQSTTEVELICSFHPPEVYNGQALAVHRSCRISSGSGWLLQFHHSIVMVDLVLGRVVKQLEALRDSFEVHVIHVIHVLANSMN